MYTKTVNYRPNIDNFDDLIVNLQIKQDAVPDIKKVLTESSELSFDALREDELRAPQAPYKAAAAVAAKSEDVFKLAADASISEESKINDANQSSD